MSDKVDNYLTSKINYSAVFVQSIYECVSGSHNIIAFQILSFHLSSATW